MDTISTIRTRRSIRVFKKKKIPDEVLYTILESARWAPSAGNVQPWRIVVVESQAGKDILAEETVDSDFISKAPVVLIVCSDPSGYEKEFEDSAEKFCTQSTAAAIQNILLTAHELGIGAVWVGSFAEAKIKKEFKISGNVAAIIPLGYADEKPILPHRIQMADYVFFEKFGDQGRGENIFPIAEQVGKIKTGLKEFAKKFKKK